MTCTRSPSGTTPRSSGPRPRPGARRSSALQLADNFLDAAHFPTVHTQTFGTPEAAYVSPHHVTREGWEIRTVYEAPYRNHDDPLVAGGEHPLVQPHVLTKVGRPPASVYLTLDFPLTGHRLAILFVCQPETATSTASTSSWPATGPAPPRASPSSSRTKTSCSTRTSRSSSSTRPWRWRPSRGEPIPEEPVPEEPVPEEKLHTAADKLSVAYRRVLAELEALESPT